MPELTKRNAYRKYHSKMEDEKAQSYAIMAQSKEFKKIYAKYLIFIKEILNIFNKPIRILNIGFAAAILENKILSEFENRVEIISIDNSKTFLAIASKNNKKYLERSTLELKLVDILEDDLNLGKFDLIISRDLNHHLDNVKILLFKCYESLEENGIFLLEDLRFDADQKAIKNFCNLIFDISEYKNKRWFLYHKLLGLIESFTVSYTTTEIKQILSESKFKWFLQNSPSRYHFLLARNDNIIDKCKDVLINMIG